MLSADSRNHLFFTLLARRLDIPGLCGISVCDTNIADAENRKSTTLGKQLKVQGTKARINYVSAVNERYLFGERSVWFVPEFLSNLREFYRYRNNCNKWTLT